MESCLTFAPPLRLPLRPPRRPRVAYGSHYSHQSHSFSPHTTTLRLQTPPPRRSTPPPTPPSPPSSSPPTTATPPASTRASSPSVNAAPADNADDVEHELTTSVSPTLWGATTAGRSVRTLVAAVSVLAALAWPLVTKEPAPDLSEPSDTTVLEALYAAINGPHFSVAVGMGFSALVQALTGFGFAIVSVGALSQLPWIANSSVFNIVQPVAATIGALTGWLLLLPNLKEIRWRQISVLLIASTLSTPFGAALPDLIDPTLLIHGLGALITAYVLYSLTGISVPKSLGRTPAAWLLGVFAGALGGAFDISGPPLVVHAEAAEWDTASGDFRRNLLAVVSVNSTVVVLWDWLSGRLNDFYYTHFLIYALPTSVVGIVIGKYLADRMDPAMFKKVVLGTCMVMGVKLLLS